MNTTYQRQAIRCADDIRAIADHAGSHFFSPDTMRFFKSRILSDAFPATSNPGNRFAAVEGARFAFITSESNEWEGRRYTVRIATLGTDQDGRQSVDISALDEGYRVATAAIARKIAREWADKN